MYLHAQQAFFHAIDGIVIGHITHQLVVDVVLQAIAFGDDMKGIPIFLS